MIQLQQAPSLKLLTKVDRAIEDVAFGYVRLIHFIRQPGSMELVDVSSHHGAQFVQLDGLYPLYPIAHFRSPRFMNYRNMDLPSPGTPDVHRPI